MSCSQTKSAEYCHSHEKPLNVHGSKVQFCAEPLSIHVRGVVPTVMPLNPLGHADTPSCPGASPEPQSWMG